MDCANYTNYILDFRNRLIKRKKYLARWVKNNNIGVYRLYDRDIPNIPITIDIYECQKLVSKRLLNNECERAYYTYLVEQLKNCDCDKSVVTNNQKEQYFVIQNWKKTRDFNCTQESKKINDEQQELNIDKEVLNNEQYKNYKNQAINSQKIFNGKQFNAGDAGVLRQKDLINSEWLNIIKDVFKTDDAHIIIKERFRHSHKNGSQYKADLQWLNAGYQNLNNKMQLPENKNQVENKSQRLLNHKDQNKNSKNQMLGNEWQESSDLNCILNDSQKAIISGTGGSDIMGLVQEGKFYFLVNLTRYIDTGIFCDMRSMRQRIFQEVKGKSVLNLFCYTGGFTVAAVTGGAASVESVDLSGTYLDWAKKNVELNCTLLNFNSYNNNNGSVVKNDVSQNKITQSKTITTYIKNDCISFLNACKKKYDIIICDPPTFSNSKMAGTFDVKEDYKLLIDLCLKNLNNGGTLYFSTNARSFTLNYPQLHGYIKDITASTISKDFGCYKTPHKVYCIKK